MGLKEVFHFKMPEIATIPRCSFSVVYHQILVWALVILGLSRKGVPICAESV